MFEYHSFSVNTQAGSPTDQLNKLGLDGWEAFAIRESGHILHFYLKRKVELLLKSGDSPLEEVLSESGYVKLDKKSPVEQIS